MQFDFFTSSIFYVAVAIIIIILIILMIKMGYKKFKTDVYVILFRRGKIKYSGRGGSFFLIPFIDKYITISSRIVETKKSVENILTGERMKISVDTYLVWQVDNPEKYYYKFLDQNPLEVVKKIIDETVTDFFQTMYYSEFIKKQPKYIPRIQRRLSNTLEKYGIKVVKFGIPKISSK